MQKQLIIILLFISTLPCSYAQSILIKAGKVFDGENMYSNWDILIEGDSIKQINGNIETTPDTRILDFSNYTLLPGLIEGHSHLLLHPYNEVSWNDQVLKESEAERAIRGAVHARKTLEAGFTTLRDLGSEGAGYADVGLKESIEKGVILGPRLLVAGKAIVATGSYGPKGFADHVSVPLGAEIADGQDNLTKVVRDQIGKGADVIKVYGDYRWGPYGKAMPTFTLAEMKLIVEIANSSGREVVAHAVTEEAMRRAILAGVSTIEHGDAATDEIYILMVEHDVCLCPTLAAGDAIMQYRGWQKSTEEDPPRIKAKKKSFKAALTAGVKICAGGDVGVYAHGDNVREQEMMITYGMSHLDVLRSSTSINADVFGISHLVGRIKSGLLADLIVINGDPRENISNLRNIKLVMKEGEIIVLKDKE